MSISTFDGPSTRHFALHNQQQKPKKKLPNDSMNIFGKKNKIRGKQLYIETGPKLPDENSL